MFRRHHLRVATAALPWRRWRARHQQDKATAGFRHCCASCRCVAERRSRVKGAGHRRGAAGARRQGVGAADALRLQGGDRPHVGAGVAFGVVAGLVPPIPSRASPGCSPTICATPCSRRSGSARRASWPARCSATSTICRCASTSSGAPEPDQDRRARHQEHRHDALFPAVQHRPDDGRAGRHLRHLLRQVRPRAGRRHAGRWSRIYIAFTRVVTDWRAQVQREMNEVDNRAIGRAVDSPAQLRDGQIFRRRGARGEALRRSDRRLHRAPR